MAEGQKFGEWCRDCHRQVGIGCACGLSIKDKHVSVDKHSLLTYDKQLREEARRNGR